MLNRFTQFIKEKDLFSSESYIIAAVSGGMDSVALCHLLYKGGFKFAIAHCNFGLRGEESDQDEQFVKKLARKYKVPFFVNHFQTNEFAETEKISTQMAARYLRYQWFESLISRENAEKILTAHHKNDVAETVLFNLIRGTGLAGLHGIRPKVGCIVRPLLFATRDDIMEVVEENQLIWREDSSNESTKYQRNFIRHEIIPSIKKLNPNFEDTIENSIEKISAAESIYLNSINSVIQKAVFKERDITRVDFSIVRTEVEPTITFYEILKPYNFNYSQCKSIVESLDGESGKTFESPTHTLVKDRIELIITSRNLSNFVSAEIPEPISNFEFNNLQLEFREHNPEGYKIPTSQKIAALDKDKVKFPLELRKWKEGDWFHPLGMNKKKKLSDFFIDQKTPVNLKKQIYVLTSGGSVVWIVGQRIDNRFKISENTQKILEIKFAEL